MPKTKGGGFLLDDSELTPYGMYLEDDLTEEEKKDWEEEIEKLKKQDRI